ncbi:MAG: NAD-dependent epimerase/dehydratase family protein [Ignavibacteriae bacterium]|nr:NAD-dependent epimerase/dehydratase family protein [Ignavibacteriota bacterium]
MSKYFIAGGAGFIGSHLARRIIRENPESEIIIFDNFSSGKMWHLDEIKEKGNIKIVIDDIKNLDSLKEAMHGADVVYHFASNPDISKAVTQPDIDFWEGTYLTNNILEALRVNGIKRLLYASGSGIYGDSGYNEVDEDYSPQLPISTYGASKLACEALISSYCFMFDMNASAFRFANVVGPNQTHGVGYDFVRMLLQNNKELKILGDGSQSKSYIYVTDIVRALMTVEVQNLKGFSYFNVATLDYITVKEIADIVTGLLDLKNVEYKFTGGDRGWKGDVPIVRMNSEKIRKFGWINEFTSNEAIKNSVESIISDARQKKFNWEINI